MAVIPLQYKPGTIAEPQNTESDDMRWIETSGVHFPDLKLTPIPAYSESISSSGSVDISGTCRAQWGGRLGGTNQGAYYLFATHSHLYAQYKSVRYNMTPFEGQRNQSLDDDPLDTTNTDATLTVSWTAHGLSVGDIVIISGADDVGGVTSDTYINGVEFNVATVTDADTFTVEMGTNASSTATGGGDDITIRSIAVDTTLSNPFDTTSGSAVVTVNYTSHGLSTGDRVRFSNCSGVGGINHVEFNQEHIITYVDDDSFTITVGANALSTVSGGGGTDCFIYVGIAAGTQNQTFLSGFGAGLFGRGTFGTDRTSTTTPAFPRISSFDNFGNSFLYCPGDYTSGDGQKIYQWDGDTDTAPEVVLNAPENCNWVAVIANQIVALCGTNIVIGLTDPTTGNALWPSVPSTSPIGDVIPVQRTSRLLSVAPFGEKSGIVFAPDPYLLRLVGGVWDLTELGEGYPIVAPAAFCRYNDGIMWYAQDGNYYFCNGGSVEKIVNRQNGEWVRNRTNSNAIWTTFMMDDQKHDQAWHYYPSTGQSNPDSYVVVSPLSQSFTTGSQSRTSAQRPSIVDQEFYMTNGSTIYNSFGTDPVTFEWSAKTAFFYVDANYRHRITNLMPDCVSSDDVSVTIYGKEHPQSEEINYGTYTLSPTSTIMTVRASARLISLEFSGSSDFTLGNMMMEVRKQGKRRR